MASLYFAFAQPGAVNEKLAEELVCCICQELMIFAHVLPLCGHGFCELVRLVLIQCSRRTIVYIS